MFNAILVLGEQTLARIFENLIMGNTSFLVHLGESLVSEHAIYLLLNIILLKL
jgi:hypothetical protein